MSSCFYPLAVNSHLGCLGPYGKYSKYFEPSFVKHYILIPGTMDHVQMVTGMMIPSTLHRDIISVVSSVVQPVTSLYVSLDAPTVRGNCLYVWDS